VGRVLSGKYSEGASLTILTGGLKKLRGNRRMGVKYKGSNCNMGGEHVSSKYVVVADDEPVFRQIYVDMLAAAGYEARAFHSKREALESMKTRLPDLVISDIHLKDIDGFTFLRLLRDDPKTSSIPAIRVTGFVGKEVEEEAKKAGAVAYLTKPYKVEDLMATVKLLLLT
jgi:CheY-like chemotaxis protein